MAKPLLSDLIAICDAFAAEGARYFLSGGTLLGAVRDGALIAHDQDLDIDCLSDDVDMVERAVARLAGSGLDMRWKAGSVIERRTRARSPDRRPASALQIFRGERVIADAMMFTIFGDGLARRVAPGGTVYFNPKMTAPAWFYEGQEEVEIDGRRFTTVRSPHVMCEKVYGPDWRTPLKPGEFLPNRHRTSGSVDDADLALLIRHALDCGWDGDYSQRPVWPCPIEYVDTLANDDWIARHEPSLDPMVAAAITAGVKQFAGESDFRRRQEAHLFATAVTRPLVDELIFERRRRSAIRQELRDVEKRLAQTREASEQSPKIGSGRYGS